MQKSSIFTKVYREGMRRGLYPGRTQKARDWYRTVARSIVMGKQNKLIKQERDFRRKEIYPGFMYTFVYDAKTKDDLPYWDAFPLIFPFRKLPDGFLGINLHYLPPNLRAELMDELYPLVRDDRFNDNSRLQNFSYATLQKVASMPSYKNCIKRYLSSHVKSHLYKIPASSWDLALMLPTERFQKATKEHVWKDLFGT